MINFYKTIDGRICRIDELEDGCWIDVVNPDEREVNFLISHFSLEPDFLRASLDEEESARIESEDGNTLVIFDTPVSGKTDVGVTYSTMPIGILVTPNHVITVSLRENAIIREFTQGVVKNVQTGLKTQFVLFIMLRVATRFLQYLKQIDKISILLEKQLRKSMKNKELIQLLDLQKSLVYFSTSLKSDETTLEKMMRGRYIKLYEDDQDLLEDVLIEIKQAVEMSNIYLNILSGTMDAFASVISNNLNIVMKILASITIVISIPNIIAGFYGMNVKGLPFDQLFWFPVILSVALMGVVGFILHKKDML
ncbi:MAG: magnesium transporter CorA family protein [Oscillospiraceae bacterium]|nr:magnesium transporter CorA family protein [Oscillospiraceae bacterium]MDD3833417.1 magnesium transporter CorA family protein [Oscillospiraceae bacterium]MDD4546042.1 magnesium transporter CorA family protein [Oscillospiraceae bacterium]